MSDKNWVEVLSVKDESEAEILRSMLSSAHIPVLLRSGLPRAVFPSLSEIKVMVPKEFAETAMLIVEQSKHEEDAP
jgi:hypothetical protein